jgi:hypothetical protein
MQYQPGELRGFPIDRLVPVNVYRFSRRWQQREFDAVVEGFTHVLLEAARPLFGRLFDADSVREVEALRARGVQVALVSHGSDLRDPDVHATRDRWSPFADGTWSRLEEFRRLTARHRALLEATRAPLFVSTPDLVREWPDARWLPVVVDGAAWAAEPLRAERRPPRVLHIPSNAYVKGTDLIEPIARRLHDEGVIEYRQESGLPAAEMAARVHWADVVLEQFRIGTYSVAAAEAMAAGRLVVAHLPQDVLDVVTAATGRDVPVVAATPDDLESLLRDIAADPAPWWRRAAEGPEFAAAVHDGRISAQALAPFLGVPHDFS